MKIEFSQIFTQLIAFLIMLWIMKKFAWKPLMSILEKRKNSIQSDFDEIASKKLEIAKLFEEYNQKEKQLKSEARTKIQEAINIGKDTAKEIENQAHQKAVQILNKAEEASLYEREKMQGQIKEQIITIATLMAQKMLGEQIDTNIQDKIVEEFVKKAQFE